MSKSIRMHLESKELLPARLMLAFAEKLFDSDIATELALCALLPHGRKGGYEVSRDVIVSRMDDTYARINTTGMWIDFTCHSPLREEFAVSINGDGKVRPVLNAVATLDRVLAYSDSKPLHWFLSGSYFPHLQHAKTTANILERLAQQWQLREVPPEAAPQEESETIVLKPATEAAKTQYWLHCRVRHDLGPRTTRFGPFDGVEILDSIWGEVAGDRRHILKRHPQGWTHVSDDRKVFSSVKIAASPSL